MVHPPEHAVISVNGSIHLPCAANYSIEDFSIDGEEELGANNNEYSDASMENIQVLYHWLRNDEFIQENDKTFVVFPNGTLVVKYSSNATATYRCIANTSIEEMGSVLSKSCSVQATGNQILLFDFFEIISNIIVFSF